MGEDVVELTSTVEGVVTAVLRRAGEPVAVGEPIVVVELMKMEQPVPTDTDGVVVEVLVSPGDELSVGTVVALLDPGQAGVTTAVGAANDTAGRRGGGEAAVEPTAGGDVRRPDLARLLERRRLTTDVARPAAVAARRARDSRTARENVDDLLDDGSLVEFGGLAHAAQRRRRDEQELRERTPADGIVTGLGRIAPAGDATTDGATEDGGPDGEVGFVGDTDSADTTVAVAAYDYTVLAGTQGLHSHQKLDRILGVARDIRAPVVLYAEGGGGRPGDVDSLQGAWLGVPTFRLLAAHSSIASTVAVCHGLSFAGNAALAGVCDVVVATEPAVLGMAGPAMVAGGGLGEFPPAELGPVATHASTGAVDVVVDDEASATAVARDVVRLLRGDRSAAAGDEHRERIVGEHLRDLVPLDHRRPHDATALLELVADPASLVELRRAAAPGMRTALARVHGRPVGLLANDPRHLAGAIDSEGAESAARLLALCDVRGLPVVSLVDTPGFMVGPDADAAGAFRRTGTLFRAAAAFTAPLVAVVVRRAFGLGAMAMTGGDLRAPVATFAWPAAELGPMGLEGAVRLGARRELDAIGDDDDREARVAALLADARGRASALNVATFAEVDDVIDPADTRRLVADVLAAAGRRGHRAGPRRHDRR